VNPAPEPLPTLDYQPRVAPSRPAIVRFVVWTILIAILLGGGTAWIAMLFRSGYSRSGLTLFAGWTLLGVAVVALAGLLATTPRDAIKLSRTASVVIILAGTALLHAAAMFMISPELSQDAFRYRFDARLAAAGLSPYQPYDTDVLAGLSTPSEAAIDRLTQHLGTATIYPPAAQWVFRAAHIAGPTLRPAVSTWYPIDTLVSWSDGIPRRHAVTFSPAMRLLASVASIITAGLLLAGLSTLGKSPWYAVLFAWNPLTLIEVSGHSHIDIFGAMCLAAAAFCTLRGQWRLAMFALALATGIKPHTIVLAPLIAIAAWRAAKAWSPLPFFAIALLLIYAPLLSLPNFVRWSETVQLYAASWEANGSIYYLLTVPFRNGDGQMLETAKLTARLIGALGFFATLYAVIRARMPLADAAYWVTLIPLLLAPVVYPWYLLWGLAIVPFLQRTGGWTLLVWCATAGLSYQLLREPVWTLPPAWLAMEYVPVYLALVLEIAIAISTSRPAGGCGALAGLPVMGQSSY